MGNYKIKSHLNRGGYGNIFIGEHIYLPSRVAIKTLRNLDEKRRHQLYLEAIIMAKLNHPSIVKMLDYGLYSQAALPYLVMDLHRQNLTQRYELANGGHVPLPEAIEILSQIGAALSLGHSLGIIHRDVKPDNVLMTTPRGSDCVLADYGIAFLTNNPPQFSTDTEGTPEYMAPELLEIMANAKSDLYALATLGFQILTGYLPYEQKGPNALIAHAMGSPREFPPELETPKGVQRVILRSLLPNPNDRHESVDAFITSLRLAYEEARLDLITSAVTQLHATPGRHRAFDQSTVRLAVARAMISESQTIPAMDALRAQQPTQRMPRRLPVLAAATVVIALMFIALAAALFGIASSVAAITVIALSVMVILTFLLAILFYRKETTHMT